MGYEGVDRTGLYVLVKARLLRVPMLVRVRCVAPQPISLNQRTPVSHYDN